MQNNNLPMVIDQSTGELVPQDSDVATGSEQFLACLFDMGLGKSLGLLQDECIELDIAEESQADMRDFYDIEPLSFGNVVNQTLAVYGCAIYEFPAGLGRPAQGSDAKIWHDRYFQARILVELDGKFRIVKSSGQSLLFHIARMCKNRGWFMFRDGPIEYRFVHQGAGFPHYMDRKDKDIKRIVPRSQRGV